MHAPDFESRAHDGRVVHLQALTGREVVLFFYTQDETPLSEREGRAAFATTSRSSRSAA